MTTDEKKSLIEEISRCGDALMKIAETLEKEQCDLGNELKEKASTPKEETLLTLEDVRAVLAEKSRIGFTAQIRELLKKYGVEKLSAIKPEKYKSLLEEAKAIGYAR